MRDHGLDWVDSERWDISAKADASAREIPSGEVPAMGQKVLEDRFQLALHHETKDMPVLALAGALPAAFKESKASPPYGPANAANKPSNISPSRSWST
jgi:uncharacterized protein (TIGR03435 family)